MTPLNPQPEHSRNDCWLLDEKGMPIDRYAYTAEECRIIRATYGAVLVTGPDVPKGHAWVPRAVIEPDSEVKNPGDEGNLIIKHTFAADNGWLDWLRGCND